MPRNAPDPPCAAGALLRLGDLHRRMGRFPAAGSIVFFHGDYVHEVTPVACEPSDLTAARLSVVVSFGPKVA